MINFLLTNFYTSELTVYITSYYSYDDNYSNLLYPLFSVSYLILVYLTYNIFSSIYLTSMNAFFYAFLFYINESIPSTSYFLIFNINPSKSKS